MLFASFACAGGGTLLDNVERKSSIDILDIEQEKHNEEDEADDAVSSALPLVLVRISKSLPHCLQASGRSPFTAGRASKSTITEPCRLSITIVAPALCSVAVFFSPHFHLNSNEYSSHSISSH